MTLESDVHCDQSSLFSKVIHTPFHITIQNQNLTMGVWEAAGLICFVVVVFHSLSFLFLAPAEVLDLMVTNDGSLDALKVKWRRPSGNLNFYNITLSHLGSVKEVKSVQPPVTETRFDKLTPGRLYQVTARTISGELFTDRMATGRTCKSSASVRTL